MQITELHQVAARADDLRKTRHFYEQQLGASYLAEFDPPGLLFFDFSGTRVLFERNSPCAVLYFRVDDIHAAYEELIARGIQFDSEPHMIHKDEAGTFGEAGEEEWMAFFKDPGGNTLALASRS